MAGRSNQKPSNLCGVSSDGRICLLNFRIDAAVDDVADDDDHAWGVVEPGTLPLFDSIWYLDPVVSSEAKPGP